MHLFLRNPVVIGILCFFLILVSATYCFSGLRERLLERRQQRTASKPAVDTNAACDRLIPEINKGYGAEGPYDMDIRTIPNPLWNGEPVSVFSPKSADGQRPVIFFSHAWGGSDWKRAYTPLIRHMVSRGYTVVFSPYQTLGASENERYATLWKGFEVAVQKFRSRMDLTCVGFVGHSFGGGATPAMAHKGLIDKGWGKKGAFLYMLAPWYSFQITPEELRKFPKHTVILIQIYDKDDINDHRMAIDLYRSISLPKDNKQFLMVRSENIEGCEVTANHATPGSNPSLRLKQYAVFLPFDALTDLVFHGNTSGNDIISGTRLSSGNTAYQPLVRESDPAPQVPEKNFKFPWSSDKNPRRSSKSW